MIDGRDGGDGAGPPQRPLSVGVLADRIAAALVHHEPGWRLPRLTALARRYHVTAAEVDAAVTELASRHLLRRLPDGQVYRASPADYLVPLEGLSGLTSYVDPMGGTLVCKSRQIMRRRPAEDVGRSLELEPGEPVLTVRCLWTVGGEPGAVSASYLPERLAGSYRALAAPPFSPGAGGPGAGGPGADGPGAGVPGAGNPAAQLPVGTVAATLAQAAAGTGQPRALQIEMAPPPPSVARSLRVSVGDLVAAVTVSFEDASTRSPVALTVAMLRPEKFRIILQAQAGGVSANDANGFASAWTHADAGWDS